MASNLALDDGLLALAWEVGGLKTKRETVNLALQEFIQRREAARLVDLFGTVDFDPDYDYKARRQDRS
ncbi:MAG: type II toxin-antitoxin system VapB family antitoxin [Propionibacteriaceae bacterium]|jgi:Arc/MetJ family transcription regulator|nr:type II toxin-antitoxin system VapB family antitoxin [Propionibacteriaceae bacterium]